MSQNQITRYLTEASDCIELLYKHLDFLNFTANVCNGYEVKDVDRLHLMIETYRGNVDCQYDILQGLIRKLKRELKTTTPPPQPLQE